MCILYHPDKHQDALVKEAAQRKFEQIQRAFEVLSDPILRILYDLYGEQGLAEHLQLTPKEITQEEIHYEYEKRKLEKEELERRIKTNARSHIKATIDASPLFLDDPYTDEVMVKRSIGLAALLIDLNKVSISQSVEFPVGERDRLILGGVVESMNGIGMPRLTATYQKQLNDTISGHLQVGLGLSRYANVAMTKRFGSILYTQVAGTIGKINDEPILGCIMTIGRHLTPNTLATLSWKEGSASGLYLNFNTVREDSNISTSFQLSESLGLDIAVKYGLQVAKKTRVKAGIHVGLNPGVSFGAQRKLSKYTYLGSTWDWTYLKGITLSLK
jgi:hypothetical protein